MQDFYGMKISYCVVQKKLIHNRNACMLLSTTFCWVEIRSCRKRSPFQQETLPCCSYSNNFFSFRENTKRKSCSHIDNYLHFEWFLLRKFQLKL